MNTAIYKLTAHALYYNRSRIRKSLPNFIQTLKTCIYLALFFTALLIDPSKTRIIRNICQNQEAQRKTFDNSLTQLGICRQPNQG